MVLRDPMNKMLVVVDKDQAVVAGHEVQSRGSNANMVMGVGGLHAIRENVHTSPSKRVEALPAELSLALR